MLQTFSYHMDGIANNLLMTLNDFISEHGLQLGPDINEAALQDMVINTSLLTVRQMDSVSYVV